MMEDEIKVSISMYVTRGCLVVPIQEALHKESVLSIQENILKNVYEKRIKGVIIDVSGLAILDRFMAQKIFDSAKMASLLGAETIIAGLRPGVVSSLIDLGFDQGDVQTALDLDAGFNLLGSLLDVKEESEKGDAPEHEIDIDDADEEDIDNRERENSPDEA